MKKTYHEVFSLLHRVLCTATARELMGASRAPGTSKHLRRALQALAEERASSGGDDAKSGTKSVVVPRPGNGRRSEGDDLPLLRHARATDLDSVYRLLMRSPQMEKKRDLMKLAEAFGLQANVRTKDDRHWAARKIARAIMSASDEVRSKVFSALAGDRDQQTQGWVGVIKGSR